MEQGVPGAQSEHFFELLHPNAVRTPPPPSSPPDVAGDATSPPPPPAEEQSIPPSYDFQLTRHPSISMDVFAKPGEGSKVHDPPPSLYRPPSASSSENHQGVVAHLATKFRYEKPVEEPNEGRDLVTMAAIDSTMKSYADSVLHVLETINGRLSQLETTVQGLEHSVAGLKSSEWARQEESNGRLKQLELLMEEVRTGLQLLHDKQTVVETTSPPRKPPSAEPQPPADGWQPPKVGGNNKELPSHVAYAERTPLFPPQYSLQGPPAVHPNFPPQGPPPLPQQAQPFSAPPPHGPLPSMNGPGNTSSQSSYPPPPQGNAQVPPYPPAQGNAQAPPRLPLNPPPSQHSMPMMSFHSQPSPQLPPGQTQYTAEAYSHMPPSHPHHHPAPATSAPIYLPEAPQYPPGAGHGGPRQQPLPQEVLHPSQQHVSGASQSRYDAAAGRGRMAPSYLPTPAPSVSMYETASGSGYGAPPYRAGQAIPSAPSGGGAGSYPQLPTAQPVQHVAVSGGPPPAARSALDEVVEKVVAMGFSREQVRGVVRQLTENGQSVDLNMVLDRLMNGGESPQPPRVWFGRG